MARQYGADDHLPQDSLGGGLADSLDDGVGRAILENSNAACRVLLRRWLRAQLPSGLLPGIPVAPVNTVTTFSLVFQSSAPGESIQNMVITSLTW